MVRRSRYLMGFGRRSERCRAGCRMADSASNRYTAPPLRCGPSGDPPPSTQRSAAMAASKLPATGRSLDAVSQWGSWRRVLPVTVTVAPSAAWGSGPGTLAPRRRTTPPRPLHSTSRTGVVMRWRPPLGFRPYLCPGAGEAWRHGNRRDGGGSGRWRCCGCRPAWSRRRSSDSGRTAGRRRSPACGSRRCR